MVTPALSTKDKNRKTIQKVPYSYLDEKWVAEYVYPNDIKTMEYYNLLKTSDAKAWWKEETASLKYNYRKLHEPSISVLQ